MMARGNRISLLRDACVQIAYPVGGCSLNALQDRGERSAVVSRCTFQILVDRHRGIYVAS